MHMVSDSAAVQLWTGSGVFTLQIETTKIKVGFYMSIKSKYSFQELGKMKYNDLQAKILQYLYIHPEGVTGAKMASHCGVSLNTIRREFTKIYDMPGEESFEVISRPSVGYQLNITDAAKTKAFFQQLNKKMNNPLFDNNDPKTYKVNAIIRKLLTGNHYINLVQLTELFNYSESSLRRDLKEVEKQIIPYHLQLKQKKGYGFYIEGDEIDKRLCLLGQHKLFVNLSEEEKKLEPDFILTFGTDDLQMKDCIKKVRRRLEEYENLSYRLIDIPNVTNYIPLIRSRHKYADQVKIDRKKRIRLEHSGLIETAGEILKAAEELIDYDDTEIAAFATILQGYRTAGSIEQLTEKEQELLKKNAEGILTSVNHVLTVAEAMNESDMNEFLCDFYDVQNRMAFSVLQDRETYRKLRHTNVFTEDLCRGCIKWTEEHFGKEMQKDLELSFYYVLDRLLKKKTYRRDHLKLVLISTYGIAYGRYCRDVLLRKYAPYIDSIEVLEYSRIQKLKDMDFDWLLTDVRVEMLDSNLRDKVCFLETQDDVREGCKALEDIIEERSEAALGQLIHEDPIHDINTALLHEHTKQRYKNMNVYTCIDKSMSPGIYIYEPNEPFEFEGKKVKKAVIVCYHNDSFTRIALMEEELLRHRK